MLPQEKLSLLVKVTVVHFQHQSVPLILYGLLILTKMKINEKINES